METFLKINLLLVLFYLMYHLFLEPLKLLKWNRFFLISSLFIALLLPFFNYEIKQINVVEKIESNFVYENNQKITNKSINVKAEPPFKINDVLLIKVIYSLVILFFVIKLLVGLLKILKLYQTGDKQRIKTFEVILNDKITEPFSFIKIFFPKKQIDNEHYVLLHEFAHCKQFHFIDILLINIFLAIFWINPFVWFLKKKIQLNLEYLADDFVLENEKDKKSYQLSLLSFLNQSTDLNIISLAYNQPPILKRIKMMNTKTNKRSYWKFFMILPILTGFFLFFQQEVKAINVFKEVNNKNVYQVNEENKNHETDKGDDENLTEYVISNKDENFSENISDVFSLFIMKGSLEKNINNKFFEISKAFNVSLILKSIIYNSDNHIIEISISYDDNKGKKDDFVIKDINGIEPIFIGLDRKKGASQVNYWISSTEKSEKNELKGDIQMLSESIQIPPMPPMPPMPPKNKSMENFSSSFSNQVHHNLSRVSNTTNKDDILKEIEENTKEIQKYTTQIQFHSNLINQFSKKINKLTKQYEKNEKEIQFFDKEIDKHSKEIDVLSAHIDKHSDIIDKMMIELDKE